MTRDDLVREATQLGRQVQQLADRSAITDLVNRPGAWLDERRFDEARSIFIENAAAGIPGGSVSARPRPPGRVSQPGSRGPNSARHHQRARRPRAMEETG